jgi:hypothetical protein
LVDALVKVNLVVLKPTLGIAPRVLRAACLLEHVLVAPVVVGDAVELAPGNLADATVRMPKHYVVELLLLLKAGTTASLDNGRVVLLMDSCHGR